MTRFPTLFHPSQAGKYRAIAYGGLVFVIPAKAGIQWPNQSVCIRKSGIPHILDSGFRRSDEVAIHMR